MADGMDLRLIPEFDGSGSTPVSEWWEKAALVCQLRGITELEKVIPLRLAGGAFAVYQQLGVADKQDAAKIKDALLSAFGQDAFVAYEQFISRRLRPGEAADVYLADLRRLSSLFEGVSNKALACAFVAGLPDAVRQILRAGSRMETFSLEQLLTRARSIMADEGHHVAAAAVARCARAGGFFGLRNAHAPANCAGTPPVGAGGGGGGSGKSAGGSGSGGSGQSAGGGGAQRTAGSSGSGGPLCFACGGPNHLAKDCLQRRRQNGGQRGSGRCHRCGNGGHNAATCPGNGAGEGSAPASSPDYH